MLFHQKYKTTAKSEVKFIKTKKKKLFMAKKKETNSNSYWPCYVILILFAFVQFRGLFHVSNF